MGDLNNNPQTPAPQPASTDDNNNNNNNNNNNKKSIPNFGVFFHFSEFEEMLVGGQKGDVVRFPGQGEWTVTKNSNNQFTYSATLSNNAELDVIIAITTEETEVELGASGDTYTVAENTAKWTIEIRNWNFPQNMEKLEMRAQLLTNTKVKQLESCKLNENVARFSLNSLEVDNYAIVSLPLLGKAANNNNANDFTNVPVKIALNTDIGEVTFSLSEV